MLNRLFHFCKQHWLIIVVTILAAFLRWYRLPASLQFLGDQGRDALVMRRILVDHYLPAIGPITSVGGFYLGPAYYYLMAPFLWMFEYNPVGPAFATALIGIITIPILYFVTKEMLSVKTAKIAALLYALAAIPVQETRSAWNPNPMPLAALGIIYGLYQAINNKKPKWLLLTASSLAIAFQLHYMIVFLSPFLIIQLFKLGKQKQLKKYIGLSFLLLILSILPLILFEIKNDFLNINGLISFLNKHQYDSLNLWQIFLNLRGRSEEVIGMILGFGRQTTLVRTWVTRSFLLITLISVFQKPKSGFKLIVNYLFLTIASLAVFRDHVYPHYLGFLFPVTFMIAAEVLSRLKGKLLPLTILFLFLFTCNNYPKLVTTINGQGNLNSVRQAADFIKEDITDNSHQQVNVALLDGTRDYKAMNYRYFLDLNQAGILTVADYPQTQILYVVSPYQQPEVLSTPVWEIQSLLPAQLTSQWQLPNIANVYKIERL